MTPRLSLLAAALLLAACNSNAPQPQRLYQLSAQTPLDPSTKLARSVGIGPLKWPEYLNRRTLIIRQDAIRLDSSDEERWVEALDANFERVLRENLARSANPQRLQAHPWPLTDAPSLQVPLEVQQFDSNQQGETVLRARWRIVNRDKTELMPERSTEIRIKANNTTPAAMVSAQSEALARLSAEIGLQLQAAEK